MGRRRVGGNSRVLRKKRLKTSKKISHSDVVAGVNGIKKTVKLRLSKKAVHKETGTHQRATLAALKKERSQLLKRQAAERMVLKEHIHELEMRRQRIRKGEHAKMERREIGKYIRQLQEEHKKKHELELLAIEEAIKAARGSFARREADKNDEWEDIGDEEEEFGEQELQEMFAHLTT
ncbi:hypothetical protein ERJ75_000936100 [Trypanosoma vivax]|nr:hypothetical protein TRVL_04584 [Trypanosoma vivax]KAH8611705.1 hypothetical protein ERJ75_000936100 [Trypanosoma vivax]